MKLGKKAQKLFEAGYVWNVMWFEMNLVSWNICDLTRVMYFDIIILTDPSNEWSKYCLLKKKLMNNSQVEQSKDFWKINQTTLNLELNNFHTILNLSLLSGPIKKYIFQKKIIRR